jgi:UDP-glucose:(heptosyl)LPS alpha-1,3-glucosyltransferase
MRHAHVGGTERYLNHLSRYLCERGHEVTILCRTHKESPHPAVRFEVLHSFALGPAWRRWAFAKAVERYVKVRRKDFDIIFGLGKTWSQDVVRLGGGCMQTHLDLMSMGFTGAADSRTTRMRPTDHVALAIERRTFAPGAYRRIIANSGMVKRDAISRYGVDPSRIEVIHNGVDVEHFHPRYRGEKGRQVRHAAGFEDHHLVFLFLGSGFPRKGLDLLIDAFPAVLAQYAHARLLVVGHDSEQASYEKHVQELGIGHAVRFLGRRLDPEVCYGAADVYVLPTRYDAFAFSVLEALASGLPVITTDTCGAAELIESDDQGSVISVMGPLPLAVDNLRVALLHWCEPGRILPAATAARRLAEQHDIQFKLQATERLLEVVAEEKQRAA